MQKNQTFNEELYLLSSYIMMFKIQITILPMLIVKRSFIFIYDMLYAFALLASPPPSSSNYGTTSN